MLFSRLPLLTVLATGALCCHAGDTAAAATSLSTYVLGAPGVMHDNVPDTRKIMRRFLENAGVLVKWGSNAAKQAAPATPFTHADELVRMVTAKPVAKAWPAPAPPSEEIAQLGSKLDALRATENSLFAEQAAKLAAADEALKKAKAANLDDFARLIPEDKAAQTRTVFGNPSAGINEKLAAVRAFRAEKLALYLKNLEDAKRLVAEEESKLKALTADKSRVGEISKTQTRLTDLKGEAGWLPRQSEERARLITKLASLRGAENSVFAEQAGKLAAADVALRKAKAAAKLDDSVSLIPKDKADQIRGAFESPSAGVNEVLGATGSNKEIIGFISKNLNDPSRLPVAKSLVAKEESKLKALTTDKSRLNEIIKTETRLNDLKREVAAIKGLKAGFDAFNPPGLERHFNPRTRVSVSPDLGTIPEK